MQSIQELKEKADRGSRDLCLVKNEYTSAQKELLQQTQNAKLFDRWIEELIHGSISPNEIPESLNSFTRALWRTGHSERLKNQAEQIVKTYNHVIEKDLALLSIRKKKVQWLFSSKSKKKEAKEAFDELEHLIDEEYIPRIKKIVNYFDEENSDIEIAYIKAEITANLSYYLSVAERAIGRDNLEEPKTNIFDAIIFQLQSVQSALLKEEGNCSEPLSFE